ncbi:MAG: PEGA domain-containing protein [Magnetococcus sp. DMHC-6]
MSDTKTTGKRLNKQFIWFYSSVIRILFASLIFPVAAWSEASGALIIKTIPRGAEILLNDRPIGIAPILVQGVPPGTIQIKAHHPGYRPWSKTVQVIPGEETKVTLVLAQPLQETTP